MEYIAISMDSGHTNTFTVNIAEGENAAVQLPVAEILDVDKIADHVSINLQDERRYILDGDQVILHPHILGAINHLVSGMLLRLVLMPSGQWLYLDSKTLISRGVSLTQNQPTAIEI